MGDDSDGFIDSSNQQFYDPYNQYNAQQVNGNYGYFPFYPMQVSVPEYQPQFYTDYQSVSPQSYSYQNSPKSNSNSPSKLPAFAPSAVEYVPESFKVEEEPVEPTPEELQYGVTAVLEQDSGKNDFAPFVRSQNFVSPFVQDVESAEGISEYPQIPTFRIQKPIFKASLMERFSDTTLFYMFYCMPHEKHQAIAAVVLYRRGWEYYPAEQIWYLPSEGKFFDLGTLSYVERVVPTGAALLQEDVKIRKV